MTKQDIRQIYTQKVSELLAQGYQINPETMSGSQGEMAHVDLTNGSEILRVLIESKHIIGRRLYGDTLIIRVGRSTDTLDSCWHTIWNDRLETLFEIKVAKISDNFYTTMEESERMAQVRQERWRLKNRDASKPLGEAYKSVALRYIRRQPRMKTCMPEEITSLVKRTHERGKVSYEFTARGRTFTIFA